MLQLRKFELLWMKIILNDLGIDYEAPMKLFCDKLAVCIAHDPVQHDMTKHIQIDQHLWADYDIICPLRTSASGCADKGLPIKRLQDLTGKLG